MEEKDKPAEEKETKRGATACSVEGCDCDEYVAPDQGHACKTCGHYSGKHTG